MLHTRGVMLAQLLRVETPIIRCIGTGPKYITKKAFLINNKEYIVYINMINVQGKRPNYVIKPCFHMYSLCPYTYTDLDHVTLFVSMTATIN